MQEFTTAAFFKAIFVSLLVAGVLFLALSLKVPAKELLSPLWIAVLLFIGFAATAIDTVVRMRQRKTSDLPLQPPVGSAVGADSAFSMPKKTRLIVYVVVVAIVSGPKLLALFGS